MWHGTMIWVSCTYFMCCYRVTIAVKRSRCCYTSFSIRLLSFAGFITHE